MVNPLRASWWSLAIRGVAAIIFGIAALIWPGITLLVLIFWFGAYALVDGVFALAAGIRSVAHQQTRWLLFLEGIAGIVAGIIAFVWPGLTSYALLVIIAAWALVTGIFEVIAAVALRGTTTTSPWLMGLGGLASIVFGILLFAFPVSGALAILWLIGIYAIFFGLVLLYLAYHVRERAEAVDQQFGSPGI